MYLRYALIGLLAIVFAASMAFADGGFIGDIYYKDCDCSTSPDYDIVKIKDRSTGQVVFEQQMIYIVSPGYWTGAQTFPPGSYDIWVQLGPNSECDHGVVKTVIHGATTQTVNLTVLGPVEQGH